MTEDLFTDANSKHVILEDEMRSSFLSYAMSVIVSRALPDVRDGLKPVHRRILYAMSLLGNTHDKPHKKSVRVVGEVLGKFHPHGDASVYDAMVRMAQDFSMRYRLVDGQGNFGSVDGDPPAAMRYTESRMALIADTMLADIDKDTVDFVPNFDATLEEPVLLPARLPNLLANGTSGIAVGMATNIPPHNLRELIDSLLLVLERSETTIDELIKVMPGPDFPTGAMILGREGIRDAYTTGRGRIIMRARTTFETVRNGREAIIVTELPYQVNKAKLTEDIAEMVKEKKLEGISDLRDESDRDGMRLVIELKRGEVGQVVLNNLFKHSALQTSFSTNFLALDKGIPKVMTLRKMLDAFLDHRLVVIVRRAQYELLAAEKRAHILEGYRIALDNLDAVITLIRESKDPAEARIGLMSRFGLSEIQARAILELQLQRLTNMERKKIDDEYRELLKTIESLKSLLASEALQREVVKKELLEVREKYGDVRRTAILDQVGDTFVLEDLLVDEEMVIMVTAGGYIRRTATSIFNEQARGGVGVHGSSTKEEDYIYDLFTATTHSYILFFTNRGYAYKVRVADIPVGGRTAKGKHLSNLLAISSEDKVTAFVPVRDFSAEGYLFMATSLGTVKKCKISDFSNVRSFGIVAINLEADDRLMQVRPTTGSEDIILITRNGKAIRFNESGVRSMGRTAAGVRGIHLKEPVEGMPPDELVDLVVVKREADLLIVTSGGFAKRTTISGFTPHHRGGSGVICMRITPERGRIVAVLEADENDSIIVATESGMTVRTTSEQLRSMGRGAKGVKLIRLRKDDRVAGAAIIRE